MNNVENEHQDIKSVLKAFWVLRSRELLKKLDDERKKRWHQAIDLAYNNYLKLVNEEKQTLGFNVLIYYGYK